MIRVDEILAALPDVGFTLRNLFQRSDGAYQANVAHAIHGDAEFGEGATPLDALVAACRKAGLNVEDDGT